MANDPIDLDTHRNQEDLKETDSRRQTLFSLKDSQEEAIRNREKLETLFLSRKSETWLDVAAKAEYVIKLFSATREGSIPRNERLIRHLLLEMEDMHKTGEES